MSAQLLADDVEILIGEKTGSPGSLESPSGLAGSLTGSLAEFGDPDSINFDEMPEFSESEGSTEKQGKDEKDQESIMAGLIANDLVDALCYDEVGGDWYFQDYGLWRVVSEKKALKLIMKELKHRMPKGFGISKLNNMKSFLQILLLCEKWASNRHLLPMANGVLDTQRIPCS